MDEEDGWALVVVVVLLMISLALTIAVCTIDRALDPFPCSKSQHLEYKEGTTI